MKKALVLLIVGTVLSGLAAYAATAKTKAASGLATESTTAR